MTVTNRIKTIESLVPSGTRLLDIGSDHALLPISLYKKGIISGAVITDVNKGPLARSREQVAALCPGLCTNAEFLLSDGFAAVKQGNYDVAAICGMGGELIARIIADGGEKAHCPLILQPMSQADKLRAYLWDSGFCVKNEQYTREGERVYAVLSVEHIGAVTEYSLADLYLGKTRPSDSADYKAYCAKVATAAEKRLIGAVARGDNALSQQLKSLIETARDIARG